MKAWLNTHKQQVPGWADNNYSAKPVWHIFHMETQFIILYIIYLFSVFEKKRDRKKQENATKKIFALLYTGRQEIISSLVKYVRILKILQKK